MRQQSNRSKEWDAEHDLSLNSSLFKCDLIVIEIEIVYESELSASKIQLNNPFSQYRLELIVDFLPTFRPNA